MAVIARYNPSEVSLFVNGVPIGFYTKDSMFRIEDMPEKNKLIKGIRGEHTWTKNLDNSAIIAITLAGKSPSNFYLGTLLSADNFLNSGTFNVTAYLPGMNAITSNNCRLMRSPDMAVGEEPGDREWKIIVPDLGNIYLPPGNDITFGFGGFSLNF